MIIKHLTRHGNSRAIVIDKPILELLNIRDDTPVSMTTDGTCLVLRPARDATRERKFRQASDWVHKRYAKTFKRLAE